MKINEVITEAFNASTGTPNGQPNFSGLKQAAQGAKMLGRGAQAVGKGIAQGAKTVGGAVAQGVKNVGSNIANQFGTDPATGRPRSTLGYLARDFVGSSNYDASAQDKVQSLLDKGDEWLNAPANAKPNLTDDEKEQINKILQKNNSYIDWNAPSRPPAQTTPATPMTPAPNSVFVVTGPGGMEYFKGQNNNWFEKPDPRPDKFSALGALQIKDPVKVKALEKILNQKRQTIFVKPAGPGDTVNFISDPAGQSRAAKLAAKRATRKVPGARE